MQTPEDSKRMKRSIEKIYLESGAPMVRQQDRPSTPSSTLPSAPSSSPYKYLADDETEKDFEDIELVFKQANEQQSHSLLLSAVKEDMDVFCCFYKMKGEKETVFPFIKYLFMKEKDEKLTFPHFKISWKDVTDVSSFKTSKKDTMEGGEGGDDETDPQPFTTFLFHELTKYMKELFDTHCNEANKKDSLEIFQKCVGFKEQYNRGYLIHQNRVYIFFDVTPCEWLEVSAFQKGLFHWGTISEILGQGKIFQISIHEDIVALFKDKPFLQTITMEVVFEDYGMRKTYTCPLPVVFFLCEKRNGGEDGEGAAPWASSIQLVDKFDNHALLYKSQYTCLHPIFGDFFYFQPTMLSLSDEALPSSPPPRFAIFKEIKYMTHHSDLSPFNYKEFFFVKDVERWTDEDIQTYHQKYERMDTIHFREGGRDFVSVRNPGQFTNIE